MGLSLLLCLCACLRPTEEVAIAAQAEAAPSLVDPLPAAPKLEPGVRAEAVAEAPAIDGSAADAAQAFYRMHLQLQASG
ncbi:MAG: hypothetical protein ACREP7_13605, partial [Lysobacter sp.]